ncbi:MAG: penicillin-insensitive murein endopeptidase, partial [Gaiellales bacterium]
DRIVWHRSQSHGLPYNGQLHHGVALPIEGPRWVTWDPVHDRVPNRRERLYGADGTIRKLLAVLRKYRKANPDAPKVVIGDLSRKGGGPLDAHVSHQNGLDVDVYYPRLDRKLRDPGTTEHIDLELSQDLVDLFVAAGAQFVFIGYHTPLSGPRAIVQPYQNHENHMHVRFRP